MRFNFEFSNLCGSVYSQGNLCFAPDGGSLLSPVGNRVTVFDLENSKSVTLPFENGRNISCVALSPNGKVLITVDEEGRALLINYKRGSVLSRFNFKSKITCISFSPCGQFFAASHGKNVQIWGTPSLQREYAPFVLHRTFAGHFDEVLCIDWAADGSHLISGSRDLTARIVSLEARDGFPVTLAGHRESVIAAYLGRAEGSAITVTRDGAYIEWRRRSEESSPSQSKFWAYIALTTGLCADGKAQCATLHKKSNLLVVGFASGIFGLYELPGCANIHTLSISSSKISTVSINASGEWLAFGSEKLGQLLVWEWQSETYVLKQQGHSHGMQTIDYSPNGAQLVSGGTDGKVKVWNAATGLCFITFIEHTASVSVRLRLTQPRVPMLVPDTDNVAGKQAVRFMSSGNAVISASLDGSVRAFDLIRYRNFRTLTTPTPTQFLSLALDPSDEICCAGTQDSFEIFVWSMKTGRLLDVLSGHQGPVSGLEFNPLQPVLASSSWDKTVKLWDVFETKAATMTLEHASDVLCVAFRPDGKELAASSLDGHILVWNAIDGEQSGMIEARRDVAGGRKDSDKSTFAAQAASSCFSALCYSADGEALIAGGNTKWVCIYNVARRLCVKKFAISENRSLDGVASQLNSKRMTEAGPLAEIDHDSNDECGDVGDRRDDSLPGVARGAHAKRRRPAARTHSTRFAPSGRSWAAATTEGLLIFSLDQVPAEPPPCLPQREHQTTFFNECSANAWQVSSFDPLDLSLDVTPARIFESLEACNWLDALLMALRLNEAPVLRAVYQRVPVAEIPLLAAALPEPYLKRMLQLIAAQTADSPHFELGLRWAEHLLLNHHDGIAQARASYAPVLRAVHQAFSVQMTDLAKLCHSNHYALAFLAPSHVGLVEPTAMARVEKGEK